MSSNAKIAAAVAVVVAVLAGAGLWWFLRDDAPDEVSLDAATASVSTTEAPADGTPPEAPPAGIEGDWTIDADTGEFDFRSATGTFAGFRVAEELVGIGATEAVGRTGEVAGSMTIEGTTVTAAEIDIDLASITTDDSRRDNRVRGALETDRFPTATFVLTEPIELGDAAAEGDPVSVTATGELTVRDVTNTVEFPLEAQLVEGTVVVVGSLEIVFADYGVEVPSAPIVVSASDRGPIELQLLFTRP